MWEMSWNTLPLGHVGIIWCEQIWIFSFKENDDETHMVSQPWCASYPWQDVSRRFIHSSRFIKYCFANSNYSYKWCKEVVFFCFCFANVFPLQMNCVISLSTNNTAKIKTHQILTYYSVVCKAKDLHVITWSRHKPSWEIVCVQLELTNTQTKIVSSKQVETRCAHIEIINALCRKTLRAWMNALTHKGGYTCCQMCMQIPYIPRLCLCEDLFSCSTGRINGYQCQCAS